MDGSSLVAWLAGGSIAVIALLMLASGLLAMVIGWAISRLWRHRHDRVEPGKHQTILISGILSLLALMLAFTFGMALNRYESRRLLVIEDANAISTAYLRTQILDEPHRRRLSKLLLDYVDNRIALAERGPDFAARMKLNDDLLSDMWAGVRAARDSARDRAMNMSLLQAYSGIVDVDISRKIARQERVPTGVYALLYAYMLAVALVLGYVLETRRSKAIAVAHLVMLVMAITTIMDLNRPVSGYIREGQQPMVALRRALAEQPPERFDRYLPESTGSR
jgi:hypothetical protein